MMANQKALETCFASFPPCVFVLMIVFCRGTLSDIFPCEPGKDQIFCFRSNSGKFWPGVDGT